MVKVLLLGHSSVARNRMTAVLEGMSHEVGVFTNFQSALEALEKPRSDYGLIISGNVFPRGFGNLDPEGDDGVYALQFLDRCLDKRPPFILFSRNKVDRDGMPLQDYGRHFKRYRYIHKAGWDFKSLAVAVTEMLAEQAVA